MKDVTHQWNLDVSSPLAGAVAAPLHCPPVRPCMCCSSASSQCKEGEKLKAALEGL